MYKYVQILLEKKHVLFTLPEGKSVEKDPPPQKKKERSTLHWECRHVLMEGVDVSAHLTAVFSMGSTGKDR